MVMNCEEAPFRIDPDKRPIRQSLETHLDISLTEVHLDK